MTTLRYRDHQPFFPAASLFVGSPRGGSRRIAWLEPGSNPTPEQAERIYAAWEAGGRKLIRRPQSAAILGERG